MGRCTPPAPRRNEGPSCRPLAPPALPFMRIKGSKTRRGDPGPPYPCATMGTLGKSLVGVLAHLRLIHASSERFFRWRGCPRGAAKGLFFLVALPRDRGSFEGGRTSTVPRVVRPPLNTLLGPGPFSCKKAPGRGCGGWKPQATGYQGNYPEENGAGCRAERLHSHCKMES